MYRKKVVYVIKNNQIGKSAKNRHFITALQPVCEEFPSKTTDSVIPLILSKRLNELWTKNIFDSWQKTFIFKLHNNTLRYNIAVSKFVRGHSPLCTFCELSRNPEDERETPLHLFFQCRHVEPIIEIFFREILNNDFQEMTRTDFFRGFSYENSFKTLF